MPGGLPCCVRGRQGRLAAVWGPVRPGDRNCTCADILLITVDCLQADGSPAPEGLLLRQVVSKGSASRQLGGPAPYRLARRLRWGDLWPLHYQRWLRAMEPPAAEAFQQE